MTFSSASATTLISTVYSGALDFFYTVAPYAILTLAALGIAATVIAWVTGRIGGKRKIRA